MNYEKYTEIAKALADSKRVKILDMISCGKMCACDILEHFHFTQPTLSHHMKVLAEAELIITEKKGIWNYYSLNQDTMERFIQGTIKLAADSPECVCKKQYGKEADVSERMK